MPLPAKLDAFLTKLDSQIKAGPLWLYRKAKAGMPSPQTSSVQPVEATPIAAPATSNESFSMTPELQKRIVSGVILGVAVLFLTAISPITYALVAIAGWYILISEWYALTKHRGAWFTVLGALYVSSALIALTYIRMVEVNIFLAVLVVVWTGDIAAYFVGKRYGKHKIAPAISPGKSWEGLAGSMIASALVAAILGHVAPLPHAFIGVVFACLGLGGDLFESSLKRHAGVKDSGTLIPGHGGLFDRVDALLPCAIFGAIALYIRLNHG